MAQTWRIYYRSGDDEVTERVIRDLVPQAPNIVHATCALRNETRSFRLDRIEWAADAETGEIIPDPWIALGLPSQAPPPLVMPVFGPTTLTADQARSQRRADKSALFNRFKHPVIAAIKRRDLWGLFGSECFRCHSIDRLELDHHVPQDLGGRLVPGNIVLLCESCNRLKRASPPSVFYSADQLRELKPLLVKQLTIFDFKLNYARWLHHPEDYLRSLGAMDQEIQVVVCERTQWQRENPDNIGLRVFARS